MTLPVAASTNPDLDVIWKWFDFQAALIAEERKYLEGLIPLGLAAHASLRENLSSCLAGATALKKRAIMKP